jgi:hypothetical protein
MNIKQAIARSESHNERVHVEYEGSLDELLEELPSDREWCHENNDEEGREVIDVWGCDDEDSDAMSWRLCVTFVVGTN